MSTIYAAVSGYEATTASIMSGLRQKRNLALMACWKLETWRAEVVGDRWLGIAE